MKRLTVSVVTAVLFFVVVLPSLVSADAALEREKQRLTTLKQEIADLVPDLATARHKLEIARDKKRGIERAARGLRRDDNPDLHDSLKDAEAAMVAAQAKADNLRRQLHEKEVEKRQTERRIEVLRRSL